LFLLEASMNRSALPPTDMFIGHPVLIGMSMGMGFSCSNNAALGGTTWRTAQLLLSLEPGE
jgi:hypothetical protein